MPWISENDPKTVRKAQILAVTKLTSYQVFAIGLGILRKTSFYLVRGPKHAISTAYGVLHKFDRSKSNFNPNAGQFSEGVQTFRKIKSLRRFSKVYSIESSCVGLFWAFCRKFLEMSKFFKITTFSTPCLGPDRIYTTCTKNRSTPASLLRILAQWCSMRACGNNFRFWNLNFELDTSKEREKFTDHDGGVRFLKSQKIKKLYVYKGENGSPKGGAKFAHLFSGWANFAPPP